MTAILFYGDALLTLPLLSDGSVDAVVTDPPYALGFMGKAWDTHTPGGFQHWCELWAAECLRVLKPGGHLLAFGGTRTYHRLTAGIEDAGFEIRDSLHWIYGSGFPKSLDVSKAIDKAAGAEREVVGYDATRARPNRTYDSGALGNIGGSGTPSDRTDNGATLTAPATDAAKQWQGWGTALKPAHEPIVLARKPLVGTVAANVLRYGTGAINVDGCRVEGGPRPHIENAGRKDPAACYGSGKTGSRSLGETTQGRWPANVLLDEDAARVLDEQSGTLTSGKMKAGTVRSNREGWAGPMPGETAAETYGDAGGASRFFPVFKYQAKAPAKERPTVVVDDRKITHPTVKPLALMRWLVDLVTPPGGVVLDPFAGSGTTLQAAVEGGFHAVGIEAEGDYLLLAKERLAGCEGLGFTAGRFPLVEVAS